MEKPRILLLGGCGFIGRNFLSFLIQNDLASAIRIVDKVPPQVAWLSKRFQSYFDNSIVEFKSANLINPKSCKNAFESAEGSWDIVINCAGETKLGQTDPVYEEGISKLSLYCANLAAQQDVKHYVELSSGCMFSSEKAPHLEDGPVDPWTLIAKWKREVEKKLEQVPNLHYTILRLATVYGPGDRMGLTPRLMAASIYKHLSESMKLLWNSDLKLNTVHVFDVCRAIWLVCNRDDTLGQIYNVVDEADSSQGSLMELVAELFNINVVYLGTTISSFIDLNVAVDDANDKHLTAWAEVCRNDGIQNTPLSPHMDAELLLHKHLRLSGDKLRQLGFKLDVPEPNCEKLKEIIDEYVEMKVFPNSLSV